MRQPSPYPSPKYPDAKKAISERARFLYGSVSHLAGSVGLTRQAFHARAVLATFSTSTHPWFEFVLYLPAGSLVEGVSASAMTERVSHADLAYALAASDDAWNARRPRAQGEG